MMYCQLCILSTLFFTSTYESNIVFLPFGTRGSHMSLLNKLAGELHRKGHEINFVMSEDVQIIKDQRFTYTFYTSTVKDIVDERFKRLSDLKSAPSPAFVLNNVIKINEKACPSILDNPNIMSTIRQSNLIITETMFLCGSLIAESAQIARVDIVATMTTQFGHLYRFPVLPSYVPETLTTYSNEMSFTERIINSITLAYTKVMMSLFIEQPMRNLQKSLKINPKKDFMEIFLKPSAIIIQGDFAIEYAQPVLPYVHYVGPFLPEKAKPLPNNDIEEFIEHSGRNGFIIVSFGSYFQIEGEIVFRMIKALGKLKQNVIISTKVILKDLPENIKSFPWIPQNDLLGHKNIKLFISHSGHNSAYEAAYHGVPMIAVPLALDQPYVANKLMKKAKMAAIIDIRNDSEEKWYEVINEVLNNQWYKGNATRVSKLLQSKDERSKPVGKAVSIIEEVIDNHFETNHLYKTSTQQNILIENGYEIIVIFMLLGILLFSIMKYLLHLCTSSVKQKLD